MRFSLATPAALLSLLSLVNANCETGPFISTLAGIPFDKTADYEHFCVSQWEEGSIITGIRVWSAKFQVKAVQFQTAGGDWGTRYGQIPTNSVQPKEKTWDENAKIGVKLWNNKPDDGDAMDAVGKIAITEEGKDDFEAGGSKLAKEMYVDNPSGKLLAVKGAAGAWVSSLEFKFLESAITNVEMTSMTFKEDMSKWNEKKQGMQPAVLGSVYYTNSDEVGGYNATYGTTTVITKSISKTITESQTHTAGYSLSVKVSSKLEVPLLAEGGIEVTNELSYSYSNMKSSAKTDTDTWSFQWTMGGQSTGIPPQTAAHCTATATQGTFDSDYDAKITATLSNGKTFEYNSHGHYNSIGFADGIQDCNVIPLKDVPKDATVKEGTKDKGKRATRLDRFVTKV
ncbi:hypothetical protein P280DRAFT_546334 [Massarina eburnea CBS 473.64]|uniref:Jacalin-type lectin domain-containing protein n=1 Tax=Massarina eburnea CBS 473.64 TaxID=1395130 RepID=A0A6A6SCC1_9PLEO|nr:hypothetical protein P280DRAFT_546334 [Massarina eburnea CBS 473.64]